MNAPARRAATSQGMNQDAVGAARMTRSPPYHEIAAETREPEGPLLEIFWGKGDAAKALYREVQEIKARKYPPPTKPAKTARKPRKPSIRKLAEQAEKAGKTVTSITTADGTKLDFGEADRATNFNPWDRVLPNASKIPS